MTARALTDGELQRLRYELGANVLLVNAEPYIPHQRVFDIIQSNLASDTNAILMASTSVTAAGSATLTLDAVTGLTQMGRVVVDTDDAYEIATVKRISGLTITVQCQKVHTSPFPVEIESGLTLVRCKLWTLGSVERQMFDAAGAAGIKRADEVEFFSKTEGGLLDSLRAQQAMHRTELASLVNLQQVLDGLGFRSGGVGFSLY